MSKSLLEQLPRIVADGRAQAERIIEGLEGKHRIGLQTREWVLPSKDVSAGDWIAQAERRVRMGDGNRAEWTNRLIYGDNLLAMAALLAGDERTPSLRGQVDLIYIDPPFDSKADYRTKVTLPGVELEQRPTVIEQFAYSDTWSDGTASYLAMITPQLVLMREMLAASGSLYVHVGIQVSHYVKILLDDVFGKENFVQEIIWAYGSPSGGRAAGPKMVKIHEYILHYAKDYGQRHSKKIFLPYDQKYVDDWFKYQDEAGRRYRIRLRGKDEAGDNVVERQYLDESKGMPASSVWTDIKQIYADPRAYKADQTRHSEITGYETQKPEKLLERIIDHSCPEEGLVADFYGGSGTTAAVAERLGRRWITTDLGKPACMIMRKRLIEQDSKPFLYQAVGDYQIEAAKSHFGRSMRIGDLSEIVLSLYGALPVPAEENPLRNLGQIVFGGKKTLVLADSPSKLTGVATLRRAQALRDSLMGGWDRVVVLGWNFEPSIGDDIGKLGDERLEVLVIPPDLIDRLKKKGGIEKLRGQVRFSSLQYLSLKPVQRSGSGEEETLKITLSNYVLLSPEAINLDDENRTKLVKVMNAEPLALIEYWAVDPDYDGQVFRSVWQDYRGNTANDGDALRVVTVADVAVPYKPGERRVCVRAVDVFGFEAEVVQVVAEPKA